MANQLPTEKKKRTILKQSLTRFENYFNSLDLTSDTIDLEDLCSRLTKAEPTLEAYNEIQQNIELLDDNLDENYANIHEPERNAFETQFHRTISAVKKFIQFRMNTVNTQSNFGLSGGLSQPCNDDLPSLKIPTFDGSLDQWLNFRDTFTSIVHTKSISNIRKFHFLRLALQGEAAEVIKSLQISDNNYNVAWSLLEERYENKHLLINFHLKSLFNLPSIQKESYDGLRQLLDGSQKHLRALEVLGRPIDQWDDPMVYLITNKFDNSTRRSWEARGNSTNTPTLKDLNDFLKEKCRVLQSIDANTKDVFSHSKPTFKSNPHNKNHNSTRTLTSQDKKCPMCQNLHSIYSCQSFLKLNPFERLNNAKRMRLCINCLGEGHVTKDCRSNGCRTCAKPHHSFLHFQSNASSNNGQNSTNNVAQTSDYANSDNGQTSESPEQSTSHHSSLVANSNSKRTTLLATAIIQVSDCHGNLHECRALLDNASQSNFISQRLYDILRLPKTKIKMLVSGIGDSNHSVNYHVAVNIKSKINDFQKNVTCLVIPKITGNLSGVTFDPLFLNIPPNIILADKGFCQSTPVDLLIGADTFWELLCIGQIKLGHDLPILNKTVFGWIISGPIVFPPKFRTFLSTNSYNYFEKTKCLLSFEQEIDNKLTKFWDLEEYPKTKFVSDEDSFCEENFKNTTFRNSDGSFTVSMPLKQSPDCLGDSKANATNQFLSLERKLEKNPNLKLQYHNFIKEYIDLNHMSLAESQDNSGFFLPHHCVLKDSSTTTKLRVVFNGSANSSSGKSVNDLMLPGPTIQDFLFHILLRFRTHNVVLGADITKMYRCVYLQKEQRNLQKILWRFNPNDDIQAYTLNTVTYGLVSSAFLAIRALHEVAYQHEDYPQIASIILRDFYVDDLLTGGQSSEEVLQIKQQLSDLLQKYGFHLRKWKSNDKTIVQSTADSDIVRLGTDEEQKTLGIVWNSFTDTLEYTIATLDSSRKITKRSILSSISQIFDPLGLLSPVTVTAKIIIQKLWRLKISWDESIPTDLHSIWSNYKSQLAQLNHFKIPRHALSINPISVQLHGFADASESAYGASVYIRCVDSLGNCTSNLFCAKTRVSPIKSITIPRLELCGCLLLSELIDRVKSSIDIIFSKAFYWCDSTIAVAWINTSPDKLKIFVANRVSQIQNLTNIDDWRYVNTFDNPSDLLTRGIDPNTLITSKKWFHGPSWLILNDSEWPQHDAQIKKSNLPDMRPITTNCFVGLTENISLLISKFSDLTCLQRHIAYIFRFINNCKKTKDLRDTGSLTVQELNDSSLFLVRMVQIESFPEEYNKLLNSQAVDKKSKILSLNPFFDKFSKILRVGGRLKNSNFSYPKKYPAILPSNHHLTILIARQEHLRLLHCGQQQLLATIRERFWPLSGRNLVRKIVHECVRCFKLSAKTQQHLMGNLPAQRVTPARPFYVCGADYAGPFLLRDRKTRNFKEIKAYISLFVCFATKAIHLEVVTDLTSDCFLASLRRFISRRGKPHEIHSDNGTTYVGANSELRRFFLTNGAKIHDALLSDNIQWSFITPRAPHQGGLWEAGVKSVKYHLKRVMGDALLTYEDFSTVLCQIEACLNSRPLCPLSHDPNDPVPLTPAHFIVGESLTTIPDHNYIQINENRLSRYERLQRLVQHFWSRWAMEYISTLQERTKWKQNSQQLLKVGLLILVKEDGLPPLKWRLGRITHLHPGNDGVVRSITFKTSSGVFKRPVVKICVLPGQTEQTMYREHEN